MTGWEKPSVNNLKPVGHVPGVKAVKPKIVEAKSSTIPSWTPRPTQPQGTSLPLSIRSQPAIKREDPIEQGSVESKTKAIKRSAAGQVWEDSTLLDWDTTHFRIFVGNLSNDVTDQMIRTAFSKYESLSNVRVVRDRRSGRSKGYGFVALSNSEDYIKAMKEMNGRYIGAKPVKLTKSSWKDRNVDSDKPYK